MKKLLLLFAIMLAFSAHTFAQSRTITGTVMDEVGNAISNASVLIKGTTIGTSTNDVGHFSVNVPTGRNILVFSAVGMSEKEVSIGSQTNLSVSMSQVTGAMDEVVVVAYGTQRRGDIIGSIAKIGSEKLEDRLTTNITQALAGAAPGISATSGSGQPGSGAAIRLRGFGSISASSAPLYVVDGVPFSGNVADINPQDIESISILKDASSSALYGARAANGVVMITTKRGKLGTPQISINATTGFSERGIKEYKTLDIFQYYPVVWEAYKNSLIYRTTGALTPENAAIKASADIAGLLVYNPFNVNSGDIVKTDGTMNSSAQLLYNDFDWFGAMSRRGKRNDVSMNVSANTGKTDYLFSLNYLRDEGFVIGSNYKRFTGRINVNTQVKEWLKTGLNLSGVLANSNQANTGTSNSIVNPFNFARGIGPIYPIHAFDATGKPILQIDGTQWYDYGLHPGGVNRPQGAYQGRNLVYETMLNTNKFNRNGTTSRAYAEINLLKNLKFTTNIGLDLVNYRSDIYQNNIVGDGVTSGGYAEKSSYVDKGITFNQLLNYNKSIKNHNIDGLLGHESYSYDRNSLSASKKTQIVAGNIEFPNFVVLDEIGSFVDKYRTEGYFGRINYNFDNKYFLTGSYRRDGSSKFSPKARWGNFYSFGGSWAIMRESFMQGLDWLSDLKLRASFGEVGNDGLLDEDGNDSYYNYKAYYSLGLNNATEPGVVLTSLPNPDLAWEVNKTLNFAIDFGLFKNRIAGTIEVFQRGSSNLLFSVPLGLSSPVTTINKNIGSMNNKGIEINLIGSIIKTDNTGWDMTINFTTLKNKITKMPEESPYIISGTKRLEVGRDLYAFYLRDWHGVDPADGSQLYYKLPTATTDLRIINKDTLTTNPSNARYSYVGSAIPKFFGSIENTVKYKNLSLSFLLNYQVGGKYYDGTYGGLMTVSSSYGGAIHQDALNAWKKTGENAAIPRLDVANSSFANASSSRWLIDASYLNIRTASLSYRIPSRWLQQIKIQNAKIFLAGENLYMFAKRQGLNPTESFTGTNSNVYIPNRVLSIGANVTL